MVRLFILLKEPLESMFFLFQHHTQRLFLKFFISFYHYFFELCKVLNKQNLFNDFPMIFIIFGFVTRFQKFFLVNSNFLQESLHQFINHFSEYFVNPTIIWIIVIFLFLKIHTIRFNKTLDRGLPSWALEKVVYCIKHPSAYISHCEYLIL